VRLIGENGEQIGIVPIQKALQAANEAGLDLVEVSPTAVPPVCRIMDYGKYKYDQTKKERKSRHSQKGGLLKEVRIRPRVGIHDLETKIKTARRLLEEGDKVKITVMFRGREISHPELGVKALQQVAEGLKDIAGIDGSPSLDGRFIHVVLTPLSAVIRQARAAKVAKEGISSAQTKDS
jgi:translation initiation factor IF-3